LLVLRKFAPFTLFVMAFFKVTVTQNFSLLEATAESGCVVGGKSVVCEVVCGVTEVVETR
jgi:hypothetical protein